MSDKQKLELKRRILQYVDGCYSYTWTMDVTEEEFADGLLTLAEEAYRRIQEAE